MGIYRKKGKKKNLTGFAEQKRQTLFFFFFFRITAFSHLLFLPCINDLPSTLFLSLVLGGVCIRDRDYKDCAVAGVCQEKLPVGVPILRAAVELVPLSP